MALLFPWATKEYLLWEMSLGQIIAYYNIAVNIKNNIKEKNNSLLNSTYNEIKKKKEELKKQGLIDDEKRSENIKDQYRQKYGDI